MRLIRAVLAWWVALGVALLLGLSPAAAQTYPKLTGRVVDAANVLPPAVKADLETKLQALERDTKRQLIVATIPDLQGQELPEYGVGLFRAWGVGLKGVDNGALLLIAPNAPKGHRGPRLAVGRGLEGILTDAYAGRMIRSVMMPKLTQSGDIPGAMEAGTDAVIAQLRASPEEAKAEADAAAAEFDRTHRATRHNGGGIPFGLVIFLFIAGFMMLSFARRAGGRRYDGGDGGSGLAPVILWGLANEIGRSNWGSGGGSGWSGGGGGSDSGSSGWGGSDFGGGGGGDTGGGGASGSW